ncbi:14966_t:CDS:2, partial [Funneliformis geosporum]
TSILKKYGLKESSEVKQSTIILNNSTSKEYSTCDHYEETCKYYNKFWTDARPNILHAHLASHYSKCSNNISLEFARIIAQDLVQVEINNESFEFK